MMADNSIIHFIITGGTIDSYYDGSLDTAVTNKESIIPEFIASLKLSVLTKHTTVCLKDSKEITDTDLQKILKTIEESLDNKFIITHGTYTMPDTARFLKANLKRKDAVIILTGSFIPIKGFAPSDGPFNLGYAISQAQILPNGVYVCMNGESFQPDEVLKRISEGKFTSIFNR